LNAGEQITGVDENKTKLDAGLQAPTPPLKNQLPPKKGWKGLGHMAHVIGKIGMNAAVTAVILGGLVGDTPAAKHGPPPPTTICAPVDSATGQSQIARGFEALHQAMAIVVPDSVDHTSLEAMRSINVAVRVPEGGFIAAGGNEGLEIPPGTRLSAYLSGSGITISASPALVYHVDWYPDASIEQLTYDFGSGTFRARASGLGFDSWYEDTVVEQANRYLLPQLPATMRQAGYNPFTDPNLERNVQSMFEACTPAASASGGADLRRLTDMEIGFGFVVPRDLDAAIPNTPNHAWLTGGTRIDVDFNTGGALTNMGLTDARVTFSRPVVVGEGTELPGLFKRMDLSAINLAPNGNVTLDYELGPETTVDGFKALFVLFAVAAEPRAAGSLGNIQRTRMESFRRDIQAGLDDNLEPQLRQLIRDNDTKITGLSLVRLFGLQEEPTRPPE
jgi:hypothetical protein